jgi:hypothetical protein
MPEHAKNSFFAEHLAAFLPIFVCFRDGDPLCLSYLNPAARKRTRHAIGTAIETERVLMHSLFQL